MVEEVILVVKLKSTLLEVGGRKPQINKVPFLLCSYTLTFRREVLRTFSLQKGANLRTLQELLGHTSLSVTERYLAVTDKDKSWAVGLLDGSSDGTFK